MKKIIVCDSGLGGLNIAEHFFSAENVGKEPCELIYFNAYPSADCGFNKLPSLRAQEEVFRDVLESMKKFSPDRCLIACNTLSIVYGRLRSWYEPPFPVEGIVDIATEGMFTALKSDPRSSLLILGTKSTVESGVYRNLLIEKGIQPERIRSCACPGLATELESEPDVSDPADPDVAAGIFGHVIGTALKAATLFERKPEKLFLGLCCTHFGFVSDLWLKHFGKFVTGNVELVNPNELMGKQWKARDIRYYAKIDFFPGARENMSAYFEPRASQISDALKSAVIDKNLFKFDERMYL